MSAVALTLGMAGLNTEGHAATTPTSDADNDANQVNSGQTQDNQVALKAGASAADTSATNKEADAAGQVTKDANSSVPPVTATTPGQKLPNTEKQQNESAATDTSNSEQVTKTPVPQPQPDKDTVQKADQSATMPGDKATNTPTNSDQQEDATKNNGSQNIQALSLSLPVTSAQSVDDLIPDKNLQQLVLFAIQQDHPEITSTSQITTDLLAGLSKLDTDSNVGDAKQENDQAFYNAVIGVKSLAGLEYATNLQRLVITPEGRASNKWGNTSLRGQLQDLTALQNLRQLTAVNLGYNQISDKDTQVLANLTNLQSLNLSNNNVDDLSFVANLINLTSINFGQQATSAYKITDLTPLAKLTNLTTIMMGYNNISDISALRNITAVPNMMNFNYNHIYDITPVLGLAWQPFIGDEPFYNISANGQTLTTAPAVLNPQTQTLSTWSFAYDNLYNFNEFMQGDPQSPADSNMIGAGNWSVWHDFTANSGNLTLNWDVSRHNDLTQPAAPNGLNFSGKIIVPYTLQANTGAVTVAFQLDGGVKIAPFIILSGQSGSTQDVLDDAAIQQAIADLEKRGFAYEKPAKYNPTLTATTEESTVTYNEDAQSITLLFNPLQKIYLVDEAGNAVGQKMIKASGKTGTAWQVAIPTIAGYTYDRTEGGTPSGQELSGTIQNVNDDIYVFYKASENPVTPPVTPVDPGNPGTPVTTGTVTVHYQTEDGRSLATTTSTGTIGQPYTTQPRDFTNLKLISTSGNADGVYSAGNQDVYYTYQEIGSSEQTGNQAAKPAPAAKPVTTPMPIDLPATPGKGGQAVKVTAKTPAKVVPVKAPSKTTSIQVAGTMHQAVRTSEQAATTLPQTNEHRTSAWWGVALLMAVGSILGLGLRKRL